MKNNDLKMVIIWDCKLKKNIFLLIKEEDTNGFKLPGECQKHFFAISNQPYSSHEARTVWSIKTNNKQEERV